MSGRPPVSPSRGLDTALFASSLRVCGARESLEELLRDFREAYREGLVSRTVSYMSASGPFSTQWQAAPDKGLPARKSDVSQLSVTGPHARTSRLRMQEVSCAFCGKVAAKLKKCGRCKRTFYCSREHQEKHWSAVHGRVCEEFDEAQLRAYDCEVFVDFMSSSCCPWGDDELTAISLAYPNVVLQLRSAERGAKFCASVEAYRGAILGAHSRVTHTGEVMRLASGVVCYSGPFADLLERCADAAGAHGVGVGD